MRTVAAVDGRASGEWARPWWRGALAAARARLRSAARVLRVIVGAPDYDTYLAHMRATHPACTPLDRDDFARQRLESRYSKPGSRCC